MSITHNNQLETKSIPDDSLSNGGNDVVSQGKDDIQSENEHLDIDDWDENEETEFKEISPDKL